MSKYYYKKLPDVGKKKFYKLFSIGLILTGLLITVYVFFPLILWQVYYAPVFAEQNIAYPVPKNTIVSENIIGSLIKNATTLGVDYTNSSNWFPDHKLQKSKDLKVKSYLISIPKLKVKNAVVSTVDTNLIKHLVNYKGTSIPPEKGNAVVFGHSSLPQLFDLKNYKTIFTYLYRLSPGDEIIVDFENRKYKYIVENIIVVNPNNTKVLEQDYETSFLTLITCVPPGTIWKRLVVRARINNI